MRKRIRWFVWSLFAVLVIYTGVSIYYMEHFFPGTSVNNMNVNYLTTDQVNQLILQQAKEYKLVLKGRQAQVEEVDPENLGVTYYETDAVWQAKRAQNGFLWPRMFWQTDSYQVTAGVSFDEEQLLAAVRELKMVKSGNPPRNAWVEMTEDGYEIHPEEPVFR